ncbi:hypothetical protein ACHWQZ_G013215 [Mnemiopsis leidyi]
MSSNVINCYGNNYQRYVEEGNYNDTVEIVLGILYTLVGSAAVFGNLCAIYYFTTIDKTTDLMMGIISCWTGLVFSRSRPLYLCSEISRSKPLNYILGPLNNFSMFSGPNIIALMAVSRCVGVFLPFKFKHIFTPLRSIILLGIVLIHPLIVALLPFFVPNLEDPFSHDDYYVDAISGQILYHLYTIARETDVEQVVTHRLNIGLIAVFRFLPIVIMVVTSVAVAIKLLLYRAPTQMNNDSNKNTQRNTSITILVLATVFFISYIPFCFITIVDVGNYTEILNMGKSVFYIAPICYLVAYVSSAVNPLVYQLRGRSIFEKKKKRNGTMYINHASRQETQTRLSVVDESRL